MYPSRTQLIEKSGLKHLGVVNKIPIRPERSERQATRVTSD